MSVTSVRDHLIALRQSVANFIDKEVSQQNGIDPNIHLEAARDVSLGIENALVAYDYPPVLDLPTDSTNVTAAVRSQLQQLRDIVTLLESKNNREVLGLCLRVQQFVSSLGLGPWQPRLAGTWPRQVYVVGNGFEVSFAGLFEDASTYKAARLVIGKDPFPMTKGTNDRLSFKVQLPPDCLPASALNNCHVIKAILEVDYNLGSWTSFAKKACYEVFIGTFPLSAGESALEYHATEVTGIDKKIKRSETFMISREELQVEGRIAKLVREKPTPDWKISGTPKIVIDEAVFPVPEDHFTEDYVEVELNLPAGQQKIEGYVEFEESRPLIRGIFSTRTAPLKWGEPYDFESPTFKITIKTPDGQQVVLTETQKMNGCFQVAEVGGKYQLIAVPPVQP